MLRINFPIVSKFFLLLLLIILSASSPFTAKAKFLNINTSDSIYIFLDLRDPSTINLEFSFINKINLKGKYNATEKALKFQALVKDEYFSKLKYIKGVRAEGLLKNNELFLNEAELTYKNIPLKATGRIKNFSSPKIDLKITGKPGVLTIKTQYNQNIKKMEINSLAEVWGGKIHLISMVNPSDNKGNLSVTADNVDIAQAMDEFDIEGKKPHGKLFFEVNLKSIDFFKWENLLGEGKILISEGDIYQINFLKGLGKFLSIPDFENIVFKRAYCDLYFEGENILLENFQLNATQMNIEGAGKITTAGNIDFLLFPQFSQELIASSKGIQKYLTALLGEGIFSVSISGTIKNPVYTTNISITPSLNNIEDIVNIFKDIF